MRTMTTASVVLATTITLTNCSGSGTDVGSGKDVADMIGCTGWSDSIDEQFVTEGGTCDLDGEEVGVYYFADQEAQDNYVDIAAGFGGLYLVGDGWVVGGSRSALEGLRDQHGGTLSGAS